MKNIYAAVSIIFLLFYSCSGNNTENIIEIREKMFITQTNDIYLNPAEYLGKKIRYEGIYHEYYYPESDERLCSVFRFGPGCCGTDGYAGFEVKWNGTIPEDNAWVEVTGILNEDKTNGYLYLNVLTLKEKNARGKEFVEY